MRGERRRAHQDAGIKAGLGYAVDFLNGAAAAMDDADQPRSYGHLLASAAVQLAGVTPDRVRRSPSWSRAETT